MINLLPEEIKQELSYARLNYRLLRWVNAFLVSLVGLALITSMGILTINKHISTIQTSLDSTEKNLNSENINGVQQQVSHISSNLKLMVKVLSHEILFSKLLEQLGEITPANVILTNLSISQSQSAIDITAQSTNYNAATQLQINLADPANKIFSKADIVSINCATSSSTTNSINSQYPCTADIRAQFTSNNPFLFINSSKN